MHGHYGRHALELRPAFNSDSRYQAATADVRVRSSDDSDHSSRRDVTLADILLEFTLVSMIEVGLKLNHVLIS